MPGYSPIIMLLTIGILVMGGGVLIIFQKLSGSDVGGDSVTSLTQYYASIDYSCKTNADCVVKDVRNCCGYFPKCVNKNARVDADLVDLLCAAEGQASICGFADVQYCECVQNRCTER